MDVDFNRVGNLNGYPRLGFVLRRFSAPKKHAVCAHANLHDFLIDGGLVGNLRLQRGLHWRQSVLWRFS